MKSLSNILSNENQSENIRAQAAIQLKNAIYSKDEAVKSEYQERWLLLSDEDRDYIKNNCFATFSTETKRPSQAARLIAHIACAELSKNRWPNCIGKNFILIII